MSELLRIFRQLERFAAGWLPGGRRLCPFCGHRVHQFLPYRRGTKSLPMLSIALNVVGSDVDNFSCPRCYSHDRERHLLFYLRASGMLVEFSGMKILHFAPERQLQVVIEAAEPLAYVRADLYPADPGVRSRTKRGR